MHHKGFTHQRKALQKRNFPSGDRWFSGGALNWKDLFPCHPCSTEVLGLRQWMPPWIDQRFRACLREPCNPTHTFQRLCSRDTTPTPDTGTLQLKFLTQGTYQVSQIKAELNPTRDDRSWSVSDACSASYWGAEGSGGKDGCSLVTNCQMDFLLPFKCEALGHKEI